LACQLVSTLERSRTALGFGHRVTLATLNNLGVMWSSAGRLSETEQLYREALVAKKQFLGGMHHREPHTRHPMALAVHTPLL
jgi:hypothetical protein